MAEPELPLYECGDGCTYVTRDNPELAGSALLLNYEGISESASRSDDTWHYQGFEFEVTRDGHDPSRGVDAQLKLTVWPARPGTVAPAEGSGLQFDWLIPGMRVGYSSLSVSVDRLRTVSRPQLHVESAGESSFARVRLRPDVILVPIQVAQFVPEYADAPEPNLSEALSEANARLFFDDTWVPDVRRTNTDFVLTELDGSWSSRSVDGYAQAMESFTPDPIFEQCGIQFRMVQHLHVPAVKQGWEMSDPGNGGPLCNINSGNQLQDMREAAIHAGLQDDVPLLMHTRRLMSPECAEYDQVEEVSCQDPETCGGAPWVVVDRDHLLDDNPYLLSHQLGHLLRLHDQASDQPGCRQGSSHLMCQDAASRSGNLKGGAATASCAQAREVAALYSKRYFDTRGADF